MIHGESGESAKGGRDEAAKAQASSIISRRSYEGGGRRGAFSKLDGRTSAAAGGEGRVGGEALAACRCRGCEGVARRVDGSRHHMYML